MSKKLEELRKDKEFLELLGKETDSELAVKYNITVFFVSHLRQSMNIPAKRVLDRPDGIEELAGTMTDKEAAIKLGCKISQVYTYRRQNNIRPYKSVESSLRRENIIKEYENLGTLQKVADKHGITRERVRQILNKAGYKRRLYNFAADQ